MPRVRDLFIAIGRIGLWRFFRAVYQQVYDDNLLVWASSLAYSWLFAVFPFLIFLLALVAYLPIDSQSVQHEIGESLTNYLGPQAAPVISRNVQQVLENERRGLLTFGIAIAIWAASAGMATTMSALNVCYDVTDTRPFHKQRALAVLLTLVVATLILAVLLLLPVSTVVTRFIDDPARMVWLREHGVPVSHALLMAWNVVRWLTALLLMFVLIAMVHYFGPVVKQRFRLLTPGSVFTVLVWIGLGLFFRLYARSFARYDQTYGAVGGVIVLLFVFYLDSLVLLMGAEINSEVDLVLKGRPPQGATAAPRERAG